MEWKKVFNKKKIAGIIIGIFLVQLFIFIYNFKSEQTKQLSENAEEIMEEEAAYQEYIESFQDNIRGILQQADSLGAISIFSQKDSFSNENLKKTKKDFEKLVAVEPVYFEGDYLTEYFNYGMLNGAILMAAVLLLMIFLDEKDAGLRGMIYATPRGRENIVLRRIGALFFWDFILVVCFYGGTLLIGNLICDVKLFECLSYPVHSLMLFEKFPFPVSIGMFLAIYLIYRWILVFLISLIIWTVLYCADHMIIGVGITGLGALITYIVYKSIDATHPLNILRYSNLWYHMEGITGIAEYRNINVFSYAVSKNIVALIAGIIYIGVSVGISVWMGSHRYPCRSHGKFIVIVEKITERIMEQWENMMEKLSLSGMEYYKVLFSQKGILIIMGVFLLIFYRADFKPVQLNGYQQMYYDYMEAHMGTPDKESATEIEELEAVLENVESDYSEAQKLYENGELSDSAMMTHSLYYDSFENERIFLKQITEQTEYLRTLKEEGIDGWYVNAYSYNHLLLEGDSLNNILFICGIVLLCSGMFSVENQSGVRSIMRTTNKGKGWMFRKKIQVAVTLTLFVFLVITLLEIGQVMSVYGLSGFAAPVQSLMKLSFVPIRCSIGTFFIGVYLTKAVMIVAVALFVSMLSTVISQKLTMAFAFMICIPSVLSMAGFEMFQYLSVVNVLSVAPFLMQVHNVWIVLGICLVFFAVSILCTGHGCKMWCGVKKDGRKWD